MNINFSDPYLIVYAAVTFYMALMVYIIAKWLWNRGKIETWIDTPLGFYTKKLRPNTDKQSLTVKNKDKTTWTFTFNAGCFRKRKGWLGRKHEFLIVPLGAKEAMPSSTDTKAGWQVPYLTQKEAFTINRLDAFKIRFGKLKLPNPYIVYGTFFLTLIILVLMFMQMQGISFGQFR